MLPNAINATYFFCIKMNISRLVKIQLVFMMGILIPLVLYAGPKNEFCFMCHAKTDLKAVTPQGKNQRLYVDKATYNQSEHAELNCVMCHRATSKIGFFSIPHTTVTEGIPDCQTCHAGTFKALNAAYNLSIHQKVIPARFRCDLCHDPHQVSYFSARTNRNSIMDRIETSNASCISCHEHPTQNSAIRGINEAHLTLIRPEIHLTAVRCVDCHTNPKDHTSHHIQASKEVVSCVACHTKDSLLLSTLFRLTVPADLTAPVTPRGKSEKKGDGFLSESAQARFSGLYLVGAKRIDWLDKTIRVGFTALLALMVIHGILRLIQSRVTATAHQRIQIETTYLYRLPSRIWHGMNAVVVILLIISGFSVHFASNDYMVMEFSMAIRSHRAGGVVMIGLFSCYLTASLITGNLRQFLPHHPCFKAILQQISYYSWGTLTGRSNPFRPTPRQKFNELQKLAYCLIVFGIIPILAITGLALLFTGWIPETLFGINGTSLVAAIHYCAAAMVTLFMVGHLYLITFGEKISIPLKAIITGRHQSLRYLDDEVAARGKNSPIDETANAGPPKSADSPILPN